MGFAMQIKNEVQISGLANSKMREAIGAVCVHWSLLELMVERVIANLEGNPSVVTYKSDLAHRLGDLKVTAKRQVITNGTAGDSLTVACFA